MQMVGPWGRYLPQWLRAPCKGSGPPEAHSMQMVGPWGRYLPQWLRAPSNGSGPAICQHTHTHWTLPTTMSVLETPFNKHVSSVYQTHTCMQAPIPTLCISAKKTHNKGSRTRPIMSTLMPRSGLPVICSRATLSCDSSYLLCSYFSLLFVKMPYYPYFFVKNKNIYVNKGEKSVFNKVLMLERDYSFRMFVLN